MSCLPVTLLGVVNTVKLLTTEVHEFGYLCDDSKFSCCHCHGNHLATILIGLSLRKHDNVLNGANNSVEHSVQPGPFKSLKTILLFKTTLPCENEIV